MTGRDPRPDADELPVGTDADEAVAAGTATSDAAAAADETALADAGLPRESAAAG